MNADFDLTDAQTVNLFKIVNRLCQPGAYAAPLVGSDDQAVVVHWQTGTFIPTAYRFERAILDCLVRKGMADRASEHQRYRVTRKGRTFRQCIEAVEPA